MGNIYHQAGSYIVTQTGMPGSGSLCVGFGDTIAEAIDNLSATPYGAHESEAVAVCWAFELGYPLVDEDGNCVECGHPANNSSGWGTCDSLAHGLVDAYDDEELLDELKGETLEDDEIDWLHRHGPDLLVPSADVPHHDEHESAEGWYDSYGWHTSCEAGDVAHPVCSFGEIDDAIGVDLAHDDSCWDRVRLTPHAQEFVEAYEAAVEKGKEVSEIAVELSEMLDRAVVHFRKGDASGTIQALVEAHRFERDHGDDPATATLADRLLTPCGKVIYEDAK